MKWESNKKYEEDYFFRRFIKKYLTFLFTM